MLMKKTAKGTVCANTYEAPAAGISLGIYGEGSVCAIEYDEEAKEYVLFVNDSVVQKSGVNIKHVDTWE